MILSIIIPIFNSEKTIRRAIDSCLGNIEEAEIMLVDDGSTDSTLSIINSNYKDLLNLGKIRIISSDHKGAGNARNIGLEKSTGDWVIFLDSDDKFIDLRRVFQDIESVGTNGSIDIVDYTSSSLISDRDIVNGKNLIKDNLGLNEESKKYWDSGPANKVYRSTFLKKNKILFPTDIKIGEDLVFNQCCLLLDPLVLVINASIYKVINNDYSITHAIIKQDILDDAIALVRTVLLANIPNVIKQEFIAKNYIMMFVRFLKSNQLSENVIRDLKKYKSEFNIRKSLSIFLSLQVSLNIPKSLIGWLIWKRPDVLIILISLFRRLKY